jgi:hypothetical protein
MSNAADTKGEQNREVGTGRYAFDGGFERLCVCGHTLGQHTAERGRCPVTKKMQQPCIVEDSQGHEGCGCDCMCFKPAKVAK